MFVLLFGLWTIVTRLLFVSQPVQRQMHQSSACSAAWWRTTLLRSCRTGVCCAWTSKSLPWHGCGTPTRRRRRHPHRTSPLARVRVCRAMGDSCFTLGSCSVPWRRRQPTPSSRPSCLSCLATVRVLSNDVATVGNAVVCVPARLLLLPSASFCVSMPHLWSSLLRCLAACRVVL